MSIESYTAPQFSAAALLTIDTQCGTLDGRPFEIPGTSAILPAMALLLRRFRALGKPILHVVRLYRRDGSNVDLCRRAAVEKGADLVIEDTDGCQIAPQILPDPGVRLDCTLLLAGGLQPIGPREVALYKPRWGAFYRTPLEDYLRFLGVSTLVFMGCNFPNCPRTSIYEASERDYRVVVVDDAVSGIYDRGRRELENIGVELVRAQDLDRCLENGASQPADQSCEAASA